MSPIDMSNIIFNLHISLLLIADTGAMTPIFVTTLYAVTECKLKCIRMYVSFISNTCCTKRLIIDSASSHDHINNFIQGTAKRIGHYANFLLFIYTMSETEIQRDTLQQNAT